MKGSFHAIPNELITINIQGVSLLWPILRCYDYERLNDISKRDLIFPPSELYMRSVLSKCGKVGTQCFS